MFNGVQPELMTRAEFLKSQKDCLLSKASLLRIHTEAIFAALAELRPVSSEEVKNIMTSPEPGRWPEDGCSRRYHHNGRLFEVRPLAAENDQKRDR